MKIACTVLVGNRLLPVLSLKKPAKYTNSTLALCKHPNSGEYCIILFAGQDKTGTKYAIKRNIKQVLTRFVNEGKCTIQFHKPEHDLYIKCNVIQLKSFLHLFKRILEDKVSERELSVSSLAITPIKKKDIAPTRLLITKHSEYPSKGFPRTLEYLQINNLRKYNVDKGILYLKKLMVLDLSSNYIEVIPSELNSLQNLKELNISHNLLGKGPKEWKWLGGNLSKTLILLNLSHNELVMIPNQICKLHTLETLHLNNNALITLPTGIGNLNKLKVFTASNNNLSVFPGSMTKLQLQSIDISNNAFVPSIPNRPVLLPKHLPVCSLKEYTSRKIISAHVPYPPGSLPQTIINYLDNVKFCVCGKPCFEVFYKNSYSLSLANIAESVSRSVGDVMYVPMDCYFCSLQCFSIIFKHRTRNRIVR